MAKAKTKTKIEDVSDVTTEEALEGLQDLDATEVESIIEEADIKPELLEEKDPKWEDTQKEQKKNSSESEKKSESSTKPELTSTKVSSSKMEKDPLVVETKKPQQDKKISTQVQSEPEESKEPELRAVKTHGSTHTEAKNGIRSTFGLFHR